MSARGFPSEGIAKKNGDEQNERGTCLGRTVACRSKHVARFPVYREGSGEKQFTGAAAFLELEKAGYDQLPCTSSYQCEPSADAVVKFCRERIAPERLKGFLMAPWTLTTPDKANKIARSIELIAASKNKYYP